MSVLWNASYLWHLPDPPATFQAMAKAFWFDVTKSDWRETMVMACARICAERRVGMYRFDWRSRSVFQASPWRAWACSGC
jgi:hypothetical protein